MARIVQRLAIIIAIIASFIGYLYYAPNSEGIAQFDRIRTFAAVMKLTNLIGRTGELFGVSSRVLLIRQLSNLVRHKKYKEEDVGLQIEDTFIENVPVRIARPLNSGNNLPAIVYFHGGAFYMGSVHTHNRITSTLARQTNTVVISVDYRLAPEHPFPAGVDDCYAVTKYVLEHGDSKELQIDQSRVAIAGDSAGMLFYRYLVEPYDIKNLSGNFAAVIAMRFATNSVGKHSPRLQILIYPVLQYFDNMLPSYTQPMYNIFCYTMDHVLSIYLNETIDETIYANKHTTVEQKKHYRQYIDWSLLPSKYRTINQNPITDDQEGDPNLIERAKQTLNPEVSPLLVEDKQLAKLPPTYILSVGHDRLRDDAFIYEGRLKRVGVPVIHNHYENTFHGSLGFSGGPIILDVALEMTADLVDYIKKNL